MNFSNIKVDLLGAPKYFLSDSVLTVLDISTRQAVCLAIDNRLKFISKETLSNENLENLQISSLKPTYSETSKQPKTLASSLKLLVF